MHDYVTCVVTVQTVLNRDTVEQVLVGQRRWADSLVGEVCMARCMDEQWQRQQTQSLIRGIVKGRSRRAKSYKLHFLGFFMCSRCCHCAVLRA